MGMHRSSAGCCLAQSTSRALKCRQYRLRVCGKVLIMGGSRYIYIYNIKKLLEGCESQQGALKGSSA